MPGNRHIDRFLQHEIEVGSFPGAVYAVGSSRGIEYESALGSAVAVPLRVPAMLDTIYDCASITKPLITAALVLQAVEEGRIGLEDSFEGFRYRDLLTHTSGLRAWLPLYVYGDYFNGMIDEVRVYSRLLSLGEIRSDMSTPIGGAVDSTSPTITLNAPTLSGTIETLSAA